jgi:galactose-1-phosphate uridylyltransferase
VNASIPRCIHVLPAHGLAVLHLSKREKDSKSLEQKKSLRQKKTKKIQILKEHESHESHESGKEKVKLRIIRDKWC